MNLAVIRRKILNAGAITISYCRLIPDLLRLSRRSIVLDCGANVGHITRLLAMTGAKVIAFEPDPLAFEQLRKRCGKKKNVECIQKGVWDREAIVPLFAHAGTRSNDESFTVGSSIIAGKRNVDAARSTMIEVIDLVEFIRRCGRKIDLIKLDVEGAEIAILEKIISTETFRLFDRMYVETHQKKIPAQAKDLEEIRKKIREKGIRNIRLNWV